MNDGKERRKIVLGVTGSIAAYKAAELARVMVSDGCEVRVVMTDAAEQFITPLTMQSVTGAPVTTSFWNETEVEIGHIQLADWADLVLIAPATADVIAKLAAGFSDTPLLAIALATKSPLLVAPAMNVNMYENPRTQENIETLKKRGVQFVDPEVGALACGWNGTGRLAAPQEIYFNVRRMLATQDFKGKRLVITAGPTREAIDPVRFISNRSSGKMGVAIAIEAYKRGAEVTLIHGPMQLNLPAAVRCVAVESAADLHQALGAETSPKGAIPGADVVVMAAAVADYRPVDQAKSKIKRTGKTPNFELTENTDILAALGEKRGRSRHPVLVGFAVETGDNDQLVGEVRRKLKAKKVDLMVGNRAEEAFDHDTNRVWLLDCHGREEEVATTTKARVATKILDAVLKL